MYLPCFARSHQQFPYFNIASYFEIGGVDSIIVFSCSFFLVELIFASEKQKDEKAEKKYFKSIGWTAINLKGNK